MLSLNISLMDLTIVAAYLAASIAFGLWMSGRPHDVSDYIVGGRDVPWMAVLLSIVATETSTATFLSVPGYSYVEGGNCGFLQLAIGYVVGRYIVVAVLLPLYFRGQLFTSYEVLQQRFGHLAKQIASALFLVTRNLSDGLRLYLAAIVLEAMIGIPLAWAVAALGIATIVYTFVGGLKAVVWNDCVQFVIYIGGAIVALCVVVFRLPGGLSQLTEFGSSTGRFQVFDISSDWSQPYTLWAGLIGGAFLTLGTHGTDQLMVQRYLSSRSRSAAARALALSGWIVLAQFALFLVLGVAVACYDASFSAGSVPPDQAVARFVVDRLPVGVVGITLAAVFAAAMSTLSSSLNSSASVALNDFYIPWFAAGASQRELLGVGRLLTIFFGLVQVGVGIVSKYVTSHVVGSVLAIAGFTSGVILGVFLLGLLDRRVGSAAAVLGLAGGLAVTAVIAFATPLAWPWYAVCGSMSTCGLGLMGQFLMQRFAKW